MADLAERKDDGEIGVNPDGSTDERAARKAKVNDIWEKLKVKDPLPAKTVLPKTKKVSKSSKPSKAVPSWMVSLGIAPPKGSKLVSDQGEKLLKVTNGTADNGLNKGIQATTAHDHVEVKESARNEAEIKEISTSSGSDLKVNEVLSRLREGADTTTSSNLKTSEDSKDSTAAQSSRRKSEMHASSSSGLDSILQQICKKQKPNILDRSRKDWGQFKEEKGIEDELEAYKKSGDKYLDKVAFLQRSDLREYEKERDARLALQSKQRSETASLN
ncbi:uncharacterized protein [Physcomitrium patens]|uniref:BCNT-C domain-containing protein n=2 Tax=Physcomitrium patens TaxID=3218 RepID=A0A2K1KJU7_PHYPA|nr:craniofacial development protein 1-like [Physcomitrium patens]PNR54045.1 hypothetical protein PHYPA_007721 [Physcomitrium patens]|eukprot:XP_024375030.1 craniofacial development protein 1-like [Physcomitrella patens]